MKSGVDETRQVDDGYETRRVDDGWHGMFEFVYYASGKQRPKTLYGFVIVISTPS